MHLFGQMASLFDYDNLFVNDSLLSSSPLGFSLSSSFRLAEESCASATSLPSDDIWRKFGILPTPPVSPLRDPLDAATVKSSLEDEELDLGLPDDLLGMDVPNFLDDEWLLADIFPSDPSPAASCSSIKCEVGELRHDCMWAGHCPSEEHRRERDLSLQSPCESLLPSCESRRPRLDTLGSTRPETPLSLSDSEAEESSNDSDDDCEPSQIPTTNPRPPVIKTNAATVIPDHSYSHSDHSYHSQRRPSENLGIETPSDSEEEIDVVSLGEVLRVQPCPAATSSNVSSSKNHATAQCKNVANPLKLKIRVAPAASSTSSSGLSSRKSSLPSQPTALVRRQLQMQLAAATAAQQQRKSDDSQQQQSSRKRLRVDASSGSASPKKRASRQSSDSEDCEKRNLHNNMERQRRVDLRNAFDNLRALIPDLEATDRAAKVLILKTAAVYCHRLTSYERSLQREKESLMKQQEQMRKKLSLLQRRR